MTSVCRNNVETDMPRLPPSILACAMMPWADANKVKWLVLGCANKMTENRSYPFAVSGHQH